ncbi:hypothetical protein C4573_03115 [Candidatus Woesearchaeota archaeon]|nr:MAG: hypothetical protein C4573_03115 [Candidatus Woesearchaeota archaeon]
MNRKKLLQIVVMNLKKEGAKKISLFGSYARKEKHKDIDLIVAFKQQKSLLELIRIERELSESTGVKIDMLTENSISPFLKESIGKDIEVLYG